MTNLGSDYKDIYGLNLSRGRQTRSSKTIPWSGIIHVIFGGVHEQTLIYDTYQGDHPIPRVVTTSDPCPVYKVSRTRVLR